MFPRTMCRIKDNGHKTKDDVKYSTPISCIDKIEEEMASSNKGSKSLPRKKEYTIAKTKPGTVMIDMNLSNCENTYFIIVVLSQAS